MLLWFVSRVSQFFFVFICLYVYPLRRQRGMHDSFLFFLFFRETQPKMVFFSSQNYVGRIEVKHVQKRTETAPVSSEKAPPLFFFFFAARPVLTTAWIAGGFGSAVLPVIKPPCVRKQQRLQVSTPRGSGQHQLLGHEVLFSLFF